MASLRSIRTAGALWLALAALPAADASAASPPPVRVRVLPATGSVSGYFSVSLRPGRSARAGALELQDPTARPVAVDLDAVAGLTASTLGSTYALPGGPRNRAQGWLRLGVRRVRRAPHDRVVVPVDVNLPSAVPSGDYLAGVAVQPRRPPDVRVRGRIAVGSAQRYAIGVVVRVPGPRRPALRFVGARVISEPAGVTFWVRSRNAGNTIIPRVRGSILITRGGRTVARARVGPGTFVSGTSITYPVLARAEHPRAGAVYRVRAVLRYGRRRVARMDRRVRFGARAAARQRSYAVAPSPRSAWGAQAVLLVLAAIAAVGSALALGHRYRTGERAARRALRRAMAEARRADEPLGVLYAAGAGRRAGRALRAIRPCLRRRDRAFRLRDGGVLVLAPATSPAGSELLADELRRRLARALGDATHVGVVVAVAEPAGDGPDEVLAEASATAARALAEQLGVALRSV